MKKLLLLILFISLTSDLLAQSFSLDHLLNIIKQDVDDVNTTVLLKNWKFSNSEKDGSGTIVFWKYNPSKYDSEKADAWLRIKFFDDGNNWLFYQYNLDSYNLIKKRIQSYGMKKIRSLANENGIFTVYERQKYVIVLGVTTIDGEYTQVSTYLTSIYPKEDYYEYIIHGDS